MDATNKNLRDTSNSSAATIARAGQGDFAGLFTGIGRVHANPADAGDPVDVDPKALGASVRSLRRRARSDQLT
jgi:hypothetical protein